VTVLVIIVPGTDSSQDLQDVQCDQKSEDNQVQGEREKCFDGPFVSNTAWKTEVFQYL